MHRIYPSADLHGRFATVGDAAKGAQVDCQNFTRKWKNRGCYGKEVFSSFIIFTLEQNNKREHKNGERKQRYWKGNILGPGGLGRQRRDWVTSG